VAAACSGPGSLDLSSENASIRRGEYLIVNNQWGKALSLGSHSQTIFADEVDGQAVLGWEWSWVGTAVVAYPSIFCGDSPFDGTRTTDRLPMPVGSRGIVAWFETRTDATGIWNTSFDIFLTSTPDARRGTRTHEIMIWTEGPLDLGAFVDDLLARSYAASDAYLASISYGNEVQLGAGRTEVAGYTIEID